MWLFLTLIVEYQFISWWLSVVGRAVAQHDLFSKQQSVLCTGILPLHAAVAIAACLFTILSCSNKTRSAPQGVLHMRWVYMPVESGRILFMDQLYVDDAPCMLFIVLHFQSHDSVSQPIPTSQITSPHFIQYIFCT